MLDKRDRLGELETVIERGLTTFVEVGNAIREIRDSRLYKDSHDTFEKYCRERWGWSRRHANRQIEAANTVEILGPTGPNPNERQIRAIAPLAKESPDEARGVMDRVNAEHGDSATAKHVEKAATEVKTARAIRAQLPEKVRVIVEESDPDDTSLSRNVAQLRHLLDVSLKHGADAGARTALRAADGEFDRTFEAYQAEKEDAAEAEPDNTPIPPDVPYPAGDITVKPDGKPKREDSAGKKWSSAMHDIQMRLNSIRDMGGIEAMTTGWAPKDKEALHGRLTTTGQTLIELADPLKGGENE